jgi:DNA-binding response OmpR family regulator
MEQELTRATATRPETILVVDDEPAVCISLEGVLIREGFRCFSATSGHEALEIMAEHSIDLVMLDLHMPMMDGLELMHIVHNRWPTTVIIVLTGFGTLDSAVIALRNGAHDYLLKPSTPEDIKASVHKGLGKRRKSTRRYQLLSRIEASVRELTEASDAPDHAIPASETGTRPQETRLEADGLIIDLRQHRVSYQGKEIALTPIEYNTLVALVRARGHVQSYASIVKHTHGYDCTEQEARTLIKTHISHLRQKITEHTHIPCPIANVRGVGYMWSDKPSPETSGGNSCRNT